MNVFDESTKPVDPDLFLWCSNVYQAAAGLSMPVENPGARPAFQLEGKNYSFSDIPINRGMLAINKELAERGLEQGSRLAVLCRIMHLGEVLEAQELAAFRKPGDEPGTMMVSEALLRACASAKIYVERDRLGFDLADVARIAQELTDAEDGDQAALDAT